MPGHSASEDTRRRAYAPGIHPKEALQSKRMDCRVKPGNDARGLVLAPMLTQRTGCAQRGADALRRRRKLVDRDAERGEGIVDGVDDRRRRADGAALAQSLRL